MNNYAFYKINKSFEDTFRNVGRLVLFCLKKELTFYSLFHINNKIDVVLLPKTSIYITEEHERVESIQDDAHWENVLFTSVLKVDREQDVIAN